MRRTKICRRCGKRKIIKKDFYFANKARTVYSVECKKCCKRRTTRYRKENPKARLAIDRKYKYGISSNEVDGLLKRQQGKCAICKTGSPTHLDHDHRFNKVRGLLCGPCNKGLGNFRDDPRYLLSAARYLRKHNA